MKLTKENTAALFVDMQEKMIPIMSGKEEVVNRSAVLLEGLKVLGIPMVFLQQYPEGIGEIVPALKEKMGDLKPFNKMTFSAMGDVAIIAEFERLRRTGIKNVLVCGVESHICVLQSCIDLAAVGFQPVLVADCIDSRCPFNKKIAMKRAVQDGAYLTTLETALFELCVRSGTDEFRAISKLIK